jgi:GT2 family glycosyltransferase
MGKVYIIIVNYKKYIDTIECLESVIKSDYKNFQVLLIDNSPSESSSVNLTRWFNNEYGKVETLYESLVYPLNNNRIVYKILTENEIKRSSKVYTEQFVLIKAKNRGFAAANNIALSYILQVGQKGEFIWVLNNDTVINKDCLSNLVSFYNQANNDDKLIGGKLMHYYKRGYLQSIAANYNTWLGVTRHIGDGEFDNGQYDNYKIKDTNYIVGACMFLPFSYLQKVRLMNEEYFIYFEELDWLLSAAKSKLSYDIQSKAVVYHKEGSSIMGTKENKNMDVADYYINVNRIKFTLRWYPNYIYTVGLGVAYSLLKRLLQLRIKLTIRIIKSIISLKSKNRIFF